MVLSVMEVLLRLITTIQMAEDADDVDYERVSDGSVLITAWLEDE